MAGNGIKGLFGPPNGATHLMESLGRLTALVQKNMRSRKSRDIPFGQALALLEEQAGDDEPLIEAVGLLKELNQQGAFDDVSFEVVWSLLRNLSKSVN